MFTPEEEAALAEVRARAREEGRREGKLAEMTRITEVMDFSAAWHGCECPRCRGVAQDIAFETDWPADRCKKIIMRCVHGSEMLH